MDVMVALNEDEFDVDRFLSTLIPMAYFVFKLYIFVSRFSLARIKWLIS